jgi:hypothetical protein
MMMIGAKDLSLVFMIGSSLISTIIPILPLSMLKGKLKNVNNSQLIGPMLGLILGVGAVIAYILYKTIKVLKKVSFILVGLLIGLLISGVSLSMDIPRQLFNFTKENEKTIIPILSIGFALFFELVIKNSIIFMM